MTVHAKLGASGAHRWMNCGASVRLAQLAPPGAGDTFYAQEGTAAHALAELCLKRQMDAADYIDAELEGFKVDAEMAEAVQRFVDLVREHHHGASFTWVEKTFSLEELGPPAEMFGTADAVALRDRTLYVDDLKYGRGLRVDAERNPQLMYYGLGALLQVEQEVGAGRIDTIEMTICQPRLEHVSTFAISYPELVDFAGELLEAAKLALRPDAPAMPGEWCTFCKGAPFCSAKMEQVVAVAKAEFSAPLPVVSLPSPDRLSDEERRKVFAVMGQIEEWFESLRQWERAELLAGRPVPGRKLVSGRLGNRKWRDEEEAISFLKHIGYREEDLLVTALKSPAQLEKLFKKAKATIPDHLVERAPGKVAVVDASDPRPALVVGSEFLAIGSGAQTAPDLLDL